MLNSVGEMQNPTKPQAGESVASARAAALSPIHTPDGSRDGSDEPAAAVAVPPEPPRTGPRWRRTAVWAHCLMFLLGCAIAGVMMWSVEKPHERKHRRRAKRREKQINDDLDAIIAAFDARNDTAMSSLTQELKTRVDASCDLAVPSQFDWSYAGSLYFVATVVTTIGYGSFAPQTTAGKALTCYIAIVGIAWFAFILSILMDNLLTVVTWIDKKVHCDDAKETTHLGIFMQACMWNAGYILFVTAVASWGYGITFGNAAYFTVITFTTVGLGDVAPPFLHHDTTYADVVGQYLFFAASSLFGLVLLALLLTALDQLLQKRLSKGIDRVAAGMLSLRRRYSSDPSGRRRTSGGQREAAAGAPTTSA